MAREWLERREKILHDGYLAIQNDKRWLDHPYSVSLETYSKCNAACTFCPYPGLDRIGQKLDDKVVFRVIDELSEGVHPHHISMAKINEPLLDVRFFDFCAYINEKLPQTGISLFSNGSTLHDKMINRLIEVKNIIFMVISLNDHRPAEYEASMKISYEKTMRRVRPLHERKVRGDIPFPIALTRVGDGTSADQEFLKWAKVEFPKFGAQCLHQFEWVGEDAGVSYLGGAQAGCSQWFSLQINGDGTESFCCIDTGSVKNGLNINTMSVSEMYNQPWRRALRERAMMRTEVPECATCTHGLNETLQPDSD